MAESGGSDATPVKRFRHKNSGRGKSFAADSSSAASGFGRMPRTESFKRWRPAASTTTSNSNGARRRPPGRRSDKLAVALPVQPVPQENVIAMFRMIKNAVPARTRPEQQDGQERQREPH